MEINQAAIEEAIVRQVSDELVGKDDLYSRIRTAVDERINKFFIENANSQIETAIASMIRSGFDHEYQKVDSFGRPQGEKTTVREQLEKHIAGYWNAPVDKAGKAVENGSYGRVGTRAEWVMMQMVAADFQGEMKQHVVNLGGLLKDKLRLELHETVNKLLSEVFHVRSQADEAARRGDSSVIAPKSK